LARGLLVGPELPVVEHLEDPVERRAVVTAVIADGDVRLVRAGELRDEVLLPKLRDVHPETSRTRFDDTLDGVAGLRPRSAAVGIHRGRVGEDARHLAVARADRVDTV